MRFFRLARVGPPPFLLLVSLTLSGFAQNASMTDTSSPHASASLLSQLQAARVTAVPKALVIGGRTVCAAEGNSPDKNLQKLDSQKNRVDIPNPNSYIPIGWDVLKGLPSNSPDDLQSAPVMVTGYLSHKINVEDKTGESTNCDLLNDNEVDWHIYFTKAPNQPISPTVISKAIIVETTPRTRPLHQWNESDLENLVNTNKEVRISGWLMYDFQHVGEIGTERATVWEVHPITRIEVSDGSGGWKNIEQKP